MHRSGAEAYVYTGLKVGRADRPLAHPRHARAARQRPQGASMLLGKMN